MNDSDSKPKNSGGCGYLLFIAATTCVLFIINAGIVGMLFSWYEARQPWIGSDLRIRQAAIFLIPVVMVLMQYWIYDFIVDRVNAVRSQMNQ